MERVVEILMRRDAINRAEAISRCEECADLLQEAVDEGHFLDCDEIIMDELGLEPDYILDLINSI